MTSLPLDNPMEKDITTHSSSKNDNDNMEDEETTTTLPNTKMKDSDNDDAGTVCPLFLDGLPSDFTSNPQLAALASLLEDSDIEEADDSKKPIIEAPTPSAGRPGGGKVRSARGRSRAQRKVAPYQAPTKKQVSMGEAQLFLKMWKI